MLTPIPRRLNLIVMGNQQAAIDAVCSRIIGLDPRDIPHLRLASEYGFGSLEESAVELSGDVSFEEARRRAKGFQVGLIRVEKYFEGTNISAYAGPPPEPERTDYCWGGCPGAIEEAIEILRQVDAQTDEKMPRLHVVFGKYAGGIDAKPGERVVFIGDCAEWQGDIGGKLVKIESLYKDRSTKDPHEAKHDDVFAKMIEVSAKVAKAARDKAPIRLSGCPVSVAEQVLLLVSLSGAKNPILDPTNAVPFNKAYLQWRATQAMNAIKGKSYQVKGPCARGDGAPIVEQQAPDAEE